jgi:Flp pilus assembly protein TadG
MRPLAVLHSVLRTILCCRQGVAAAEFALIAPVIVALLLSVYDLGNAIQQQLQLQQALRAGGLYALAFPTQTGGTGNDGILEAVQQALPANLLPPNATLTATLTSGGTNPQTYYMNLTATVPYAPFILLTLTQLSARYVIRIQ